MLGARQRFLTVMEAFSFRPVVDEDLAELADIFNHEIRTSTCIFRKSTVDLANRREWLADLQLNGYPCFVIVHSSVEGGQPRTVGWCNLGRYRPAEAYDATTEVSLYIHQDFRGQGLGSRVFELVLAEARASERRFHTVIAMVAMENQLNARFWERQGFTLLGVMKDVGNKFDRVVLHNLRTRVNHLRGPINAIRGSCHKFTPRDTETTTLRSIRSFPTNPLARCLRVELYTPFSLIDTVSLLLDRSVTFSTRIEGRSRRVSSVVVIASRNQFRVQCRGYTDPRRCGHESAKIHIDGKICGVQEE